MTHRQRRTGNVDATQLQEELKRLSAPGMEGMQGMMTSLMVFWLIWPVVCGILAANRGKVWMGVFHGLMWGPFGLLFVLLGKQRHRCPTCGEMTLKTPWISPPPVTKGQLTLREAMRRLKPQGEAPGQGLRPNMEPMPPAGVVAPNTTGASPEPRSPAPGLPPGAPAILPQGRAIPLPGPLPRAGIGPRSGSPAPAPGLARSGSTPPVGAP